ncbi:MAG: hypothetical protein P0107_01180 [Nitrosomonas sp.]|nr:hypothetical protein [Nitrosomonas sp.]
MPEQLASFSAGYRSGCLDLELTAMIGQRRSGTAIVFLFFRLPLVTPAPAGASVPSVATTLPELPGTLYRL